MASVRVTDNTKNIFNDIQQKASIFLRVMADEIVTLSEPLTPKKTGRLRMDIVKQVLGLQAKIKWGKGYAIYQESKQFKNYTTPGTGPHFAQKGVKAGVRRTTDVAKRAGLI